MLNLVTFIFVSIVLALLILFFVLFLVITTRIKNKITSLIDKIENLQKELSASHIENQNAISNLETKTERINAETSTVIKQKYEECCVKLIEMQNWCIHELKKQQDHTKVTLEQMHKDFQQDSSNLKIELNNHVDNILKEIKAPLNLE